MRGPGHIADDDALAHWQRLGAHARVSERGCDGRWHDIADVARTDLWLSYGCADAALDVLEESFLDPAAHAAGATAHLLVIPARDEAGFDVEIYADGSDVHGWFGGLTQSFEDRAEATAWARRVVLEQYQLVISRYGAASEFALRPGQLSSGAPELRSGSAVAFRSFREPEIEVRMNRLATTPAAPSGPRPRLVR